MGRWPSKLRKKIEQLGREDERAKDFFLGVIREMILVYGRARTQKRISDRVIRGRAASVSSHFEALLSKWIVNRLPERYIAFVDFPVTCERKDLRNKTFYPDILFIEESAGEKRLRGVFELKLDLGYSDNEITTRLESMVSEFESVGMISYRPNRQKKSERQFIAVPSDVFLKIVVLSTANDHGRRNLYQKAEEAGLITYLITNLHPNDEDLQKNPFELMFQVINDTQTIDSWKTLISEVTKELS